MRGRRPTKKIDAAEKFAKRQGYRWVPNPDEDMPFDAIAYRQHDMIVVRVKTCRRSMGEYDLTEDFYKDDLDILNSLPFPPYTQKELWVRFAWSRKSIRFRVVKEWLVETTFIDQDPPVFTLKKTGGKLKPPAADQGTGTGASEGTALK